MKLHGRVLWLTEDPAQLKAQVDGEHLENAPSDTPPLHYGVNTDSMISGAACTLGYT